MLLWICETHMRIIINFLCIKIFQNEVKSVSNWWRWKDWVHWENFCSKWDSKLVESIIDKNGADLLAHDDYGFNDAKAVFIHKYCNDHNTKGNLVRHLQYNNVRKQRAWLVWNTRKDWQNDSIHKNVGSYNSQLEGRIDEANYFGFIYNRLAETMD